MLGKDFQTQPFGSKKREEQAAGLAAVFEEIIFCQSNKFDSQSLRLLMDMQQQNQNAQVLQLQSQVSQLKQQLKLQEQVVSKQTELEAQARKYKDRSVE